MVLVSRRCFARELKLSVSTQFEAGAQSKSKVCRDNGVNVNTFYIWKRKYAIGVLVTLQPTPKPMLAQAREAGFYEDPFNSAVRYPRIQILTVQDLFDGKHVEYPRSHDTTFRKAKRSGAQVKSTESLFDPIDPEAS